MTSYYVSAGCWICFNNITYVKPEVLSTFAQLLAQIMDALRAAKTSVVVAHGEEIPLSTEGACFGVIDTSIRVSDVLRETNLKILFLFNTAVLDLQCH